MPTALSLIEPVLALARRAGSVIMEVYASHSGKEGGEFASKSDGSPVTEADLLAHTVIASGLAAFPGALPVVSEEDAASQVHRTPKGRYWLIDPLDGTKDFLQRTGEFTVNIALIEDGSARAGVIVAPALNLAYWGAVDEGAWRDAGDGPQRLLIGNASSLTPLRVIASRNHMDDETRGYLAQLGEHSLVQAGSSLKFCRIAEGHADIYPRFGPTCEWDVAAAHAILEAAGGQVVCLDGKTLRYGKPDVINPGFIASRGGLSRPENPTASRCADKA
jgi:3'(2'), 5'-bisphosphate nucleotidase